MVSGLTLRTDWEFLNVAVLSSLISFELNGSSFTPQKSKLTDVAGNSNIDFRAAAGQRIYWFGDTQAERRIDAPWQYNLLARDNPSPD